ncbi:class I SAM-dependent methyltransferase [Methanothermococcus okinawensis]|uniref:Methyltransferase type 11 n=1 Tax=Methanothermococcus okinawensis (strain DSM 14208 / JCM 11175 / IH1) TaxID=647113 RepID=F8AKG1_METOI|nr:class I SAM-dependent methyltransferase [Methanothermococcus okinawensis]AEH07487.1 Methyltransferase type 11 [Methanothermococcus okinawensis IH1]
MNKREDKKIKNFYEDWNVETLPKYVKILMKMEEKLLTNIITNSDDFKTIYKRKNTVILDCGCGFGSFYNLTKNLDTIYFDFSYNLLKKFKNIHNLETNKICGDVSNLPFKTGSFDLVLCINVLEHIKDYKNAINEIKRVLKNNGTAIFVVVNSESFINEDIFNDFTIYHKPLCLKDFDIEGFYLKDYKTFYFIPPILKILPTSILEKILNIFYKGLDGKLSRIFKRKGQFLYVILKKK